MNTSVGVADATFWQNVAYLKHFLVKKTSKSINELDTTAYVIAHKF